MTFDQIVEAQNAGIYVIFNQVNGHYYYGQSVNIPARFYQHQNRLERGTHDNIRLQREWEKYGKDAFVFEVLAYCHPERLDELEQMMIEPDYNDPKNLNLRPLVGQYDKEMHRKKIQDARAGQQGRVISPEERVGRSKRMLGNRQNARPHPAFINEQTGEVIPAGSNLTKSIRDRGMEPKRFFELLSATRKHHSHKGWRVINEYN